MSQEYLSQYSEGAYPLALRVIWAKLPDKSMVQIFFFFFRGGHYYTKEPTVEISIFDEDLNYKSKCETDNMEIAIMAIDKFIIEPIIYEQRKENKIGP